MKNKIAIRCITEPSTGYGNLSRCITLAEGLKRKGCQITFLVNNYNQTLKQLKSKHISYKLVPNFSNNKKEAIFLNNFLSVFEFKTIILDMRQHGEALSKYLMKLQVNVILLDDAWCENAYADVIINGTNVQKYHKYKKINSSSKIFVGTKYWIINENFFKNTKKLSDIKNKKKYTIILSMGGSDISNLTLLVLKSIIKLQNLSIKVIIGPFFTNTNKLKKFSKNYKNISLIKSPNQIWKIFAKGDIVISTAGSNLFELCVQRIPTLSIIAIEHQLPYAKIFNSKGFSINLGSKKELSEIKIQKTLSLLLKNSSKRKKMLRAANQIIDGKGLERCITIIENFLKTLSC